MPPHVPGFHRCRVAGGDAHLNGTFLVARAVVPGRMARGFGRIVMLGSIGALDKAVLKFRQQCGEVTVLGLNAARATMVDRFGLHDRDEAGPAALL